MKTFLMSMIIWNFCPEIYGRMVKVVEFQSEYSPTSVEAEEALGTLNTSDMTICFRHKAKFNKHQKLMKTKQFDWNFDAGGSQIKGKNSGNFQLQPLNGSSANPTFWMNFAFNGAPGKWTSMCFSFLLTKYTIKLKLVQDGQLGWDKLYTDSSGIEFDKLYFEKGKPIKD